ncbi:MAG: C10 family peptidase, partial [Bacteroidales bacterium]|nr:C10 family peptidase [Bacteroidales bacterium]
MKKLLFLFFALTIVVGAARLEASPVSESTALKVANNFCKMQGAGDLKLVNISSKMPYREFYTFAGEDGKGFVLVSADDCVVPILGFSASSPIATEKMQSNVKGWLDDYEAQINFYRNLSDRRIRSSNSTADSIIKSYWDGLLGENPPMPPQYTSVAPLLTTTWGQQPRYNSLCPYDYYYNERTVAGCVATAVAQIMKYWNHPAIGYGSHSYTLSDYGTQSANFGATTYAWSSMPDSLTSSSSTTQVDAVATLIYHIGVAVEMDYHTSADGGSGAFNNNEGMTTTTYGTPTVPSAENALRYYFKYRSNIHHIHYSDHPHSTWVAIMQNELNNSRPILYSGRDSTGGHSFVLDGYNNSGQFHVNWGWRGNWNGYFAIGSLNLTSGGTGTTSTYSFNLKNSAVVSIQPNLNFGDTTTVTALVNSSSVGYGTVNGGGTYTGTNSNVVTLSATAASGYRFAGWTDGYMYNPRTFYANGGSYTFRANFAPLSGDTLGYCSTRYLGSYGSSGTAIWGIKIPAANLTAGHDLTKVLMYISTAGTYTLNVYTGTTSASTLVHTQTFDVSNSLAGQWCVLNLSSNVAITGTSPIWIMLQSNASYPAAVTYYAGNNDSRVWGSSFGTLTGNYSFMIQGIFTAGSSGPVYGDTVSYCDDAAFATSIGMGAARAFDWAVKLPATMVRHRNYLTDVMLYVPSVGSYTLNVYRGSATTSVTQAASQTTTFGSSAVGSWQTIHLATPVATNSTQPIWVAFHTDNIAYPAASCAYTGDSNSSLISTDSCSSWMALSTATGGTINQSWMIRVKLANTAAPSVIIDGPTSIGVGIPATFTAAGPATATYSWSLTGATHSTTSGNTATATWITPGTYNVIVTANNSGTLLRDTLAVSVHGCSINTFPFTMGFESVEEMSCWNLIDNDADGNGWQYGGSYFGSNYAHSGNDFFASASYINEVGALTPDNWLVTPQLQLSTGNNYQLSWYDAAVDSTYCSEHYSVYVSTTGNNVSNFTATPLFTTTLTTTDYTQRSIDLSAYAGQN